MNKKRISKATALQTATRKKNTFSYPRLPRSNKQYVGRVSIRQIAISNACRSDGDRHKCAALPPKITLQFWLLHIRKCVIKISVSRFVSCVQPVPKLHWLPLTSSGDVDDCYQFRGSAALHKLYVVHYGSDTTRSVSPTLRRDATWTNTGRVFKADRLKYL